MKPIRKLLCLILAVLTVSCLCACGGGSSSTGSEEKTPEQLVRSAVETRGMLAYYGSTIGGNELTRSRATVTNVKMISDTEYHVSGKIVMTDVYGTEWNNTFDCTVELSSSGSWSAGSFDYTSSNWTKG